MAPLMLDEQFNFTDGQRLDHVRPAPHTPAQEPIAVVGLAFEFPGNVKTEDGFWDMLVNGRVDQPTIPKDRFNPTAYGPQSGEELGVLSTRGAHFLDEDVAAFDAPFFSISPAEAEGMDPQQRKLLETTYHALENAGITLESIRGSKTSVHVGCFTGDYHLMQCKDPDTMPTYHATGNSSAILANRISWFFDLKGPSVMMDTACSSSLVALDQACQALRLNQTSMGIVGGCNVIVTPESVMTIGKMGFLSPDGLCHSFDESGNGYARSEGFATLILKRVSDAVRDGDTIRAVIRATATNQDGRTIGLAQPCEQAQEELLRSTYQSFGLDRSITRFVESHGTGTAVGDPIEANALCSSFNDVRSEAEPIFIGATKANIGHLEAASGIAGIIKTILVLEKGEIPPIAQLRSINPRIRAPNLKFPTTTTPWPQPGLRRASVQSFGFGGTNAHAIVDDAANFLSSRVLPYHRRTRSDSHHTIPVLSQLTTPLTPIPQLMVWSAPDKAALTRMTSSYGDHFKESHSNGSLSDDALPGIANTLSERRTKFPWRTFIVSDSVTQLVDLSSNIAPPALSLPDRKLALVFTGQGAQWPGMGRELLQYPVFVQSLLQSQKRLEDLGGKWDIMALFRGNDIDGKPVEWSGTAEISQCVCTALQIGLVDLLRSFDATPDQVVGHSSGEIGAAYATGAISAASAIQLAYFRGKLSDRLANASTRQGAMMAVALSEEEVVPYLHSSAVEVVVGCINSSKSITLSGPRSQILTLQKTLDEAGVFARVLKVPVAYHSPQMSTIATGYEAAIQGIESGDEKYSTIAMTSSVTGHKVRSNTLRSPKYWVSNLVSSVRFHDAVSNLLRSTQNRSTAAYSLLEVGPHSTFQGPIRDILQEVAPKAGSTISYHSLLARNRSSISTLLKAIGELHCNGHPLNISIVNRTSHIGNKESLTTIVNLPPYPFDHSTRYWHESRISKSLRSRRHAPHPLLGIAAMDWNPLEPRWRHFLRLENLPFIEDHLINNTIVYPAAAMIAGVLEGARQLTEINGSGRVVEGYEIRDAKFMTALVFPSRGTEIEVELRFRKVIKQDGGMAGDRSTYEFRLYSYRDNNWTYHCEGVVRVQYSAAQEAKFTTADRSPMQAALRQATEFDDLSNNSARKLGNSKLYGDLFPRFGYQYGATFQGLHALSSDGKNKASARIVPLEADAKERAEIRQQHIIHPAALDAVLQLALVAAAKGGESAIPTIVPEKISKLWVSSLGLQFPETASGDINVVAESVMRNKRKMEASASAFASSGRNLLVHVQAFEGTSISNSETNESKEKDAVDHLCYRMEWQPDIDLMSPQQLLDHCWRSINPVVPEIDIIAFERDATVLIFRAIFNFQRRLATEQITLAKPYFRKYVRWMEIQRQAFESGVYPEVRSRYEYFESNPVALKELEQRAADNKMWRFYAAVADNLFDMLTGTLDPLQLLFGEDYATDFYAETNRYSRCGPALSNYLELLAHKNPGMRVLEVGAGTGSTTRIALEALKSKEAKDVPDTERLCRFSRYDFTDISPSLVTAAQEELGPAHPKLHFTQFDIETDPATQDFETGSYDLIVAGSVLHATASISETLRHVRALLKPGGKLLLFENTRPDHVRMGFAFGLLPGWWLGVEDSRQNSPCLNKEQWDVALKECGFAGAEVEFRDFEAQECHETSVIIATTTEASLPDYVSGTKLEWPLIIADTYDATEMALAESIRLTLQKRLCLGCIIGSLDKTAASPAATGRCCIFLDIRKDSIPIMESEESYLAVRTLAKASSTIVWVSNGGGKRPSQPNHGLIAGLSRTVRRENINLRFLSLVLESPESLLEHHASMIVDAFLQTQGTSSYEPELVETDRLLHVNRILQCPDLNTKVASKMSGTDNHPRKFGESVPLMLSTGSDSGLDSLRFEEDMEVEKPLQEDEVEVEVKAIGCNFIDSLSALGRVDVDFIGLEVSGTVSRIGSENSRFNVGDAVITFALDAYRTFVRTKACLASLLPKHFSFVQGASVPINFATAYRALVDVARLQEGEIVLIHSAAGGTGQAAVQIAKRVGARIFATVGTDEKRQFLIDHYGVEPKCIFSSRDDKFLSAIQRITKNKGVDVVLNSLSGDLLHASWECIAPYGRFVEIGKKDIREGTRINMASFASNTMFASVDLAAMIRQCPEMTGRLLQNVLSLMAEKHLSPVETESFGVDQISEALRKLLGGKSLGKIVVEVDKSAIVKATTRIRHNDLFNKDATYVIAGGLGGLGRTITRWMERRGARNFLLLSRSGEASPQAAGFVEELKSRGVCVETPSCNIGDADALRAVLEGARSRMPPVRGCVQASMILQDSVFDNMSHEVFNAPLNAKVKGSWNLHTLLPSSLDFFIMLSSVAGIFGSGGQANYAAGNTYQDALAQYRVSQGQKAVSIDLGMMLSEGYLANTPETMERLEKTDGLVPVREEALFAILDEICDREKAQTEPQIIVGLGTPASMREKGIQQPWWMEQPLFRTMHQLTDSSHTSTQNAAANTSQDTRIDISTSFRTIKDTSILQGLVVDALIARLNRTMPGTFAEEGQRLAKTKVPLHSLGVDSLVAVELRNWFKKEMGAEVATFEILGGMGVEELGGVVVGRSTMVGGS
ncbi:hypothetical protein CC80DRAFT_598435 [Byssothecium circinans]|uniref:Carrier domain-containing protein n=1 Tax=Byssothecium circinans TaxID=147558 RepID=A0A6A5TCI6_9PLEO|nr:hypothetical protein CC80DRAFT_598435 [Byssothecium circinans]